ncbi:class I SAM-dependent methyltransferase [Jiangella asiatica]|uniref:Class I SAM-dependent methyltransferase n=1 Tax=Jiangella asiatica TaxID=2530372 RepID=A0A4R5DLY8_9ACTN|nr:class I SAM-dependent methyltransferase [Jiangella asiatica]TDE11895.1 class I SAM-dependent methyltransferase [Jiangella asiatica]
MAKTSDTANRPGWMLDELASAGRENLDPEHVRRYDAKEDAGAPAEVRLLQDLGLGPDAHVVDLGAGTGQFTLAVAAVCARVTAVDVSPVMLELLRSKVAAAGATNVHTVRAGFLSYEHPGHADVVYSRLALHHLPDFWKAVALCRVRAMLRPGGLLRLSDVVFAFDPADTEQRVEAWCASIEGVTADDWVRADAEEHVRDEHSTFTWLLEPVIVRAGFDIEDATYSPDGVQAAYVARAVR